MSYGAGDVSLIVGGVPIKEFNNINIVHPNPKFTAEQDANTGSSTMVKHENAKYCEITVDMKQGSAFSAIINGFYISGDSVPVIVKDNNGLDMEMIAAAKVAKLPDSGFGENLSDRSWLIIGDSSVSTRG